MNYLKSSSYLLIACLTVFSCKKSSTKYEPIIKQPATENPVKPNHTDSCMLDSSEKKKVTTQPVKTVKHNPKPKYPLIKTAKIYLTINQKPKEFQFSFYPNEFVGSSSQKGKNSDTIQDKTLEHFGYAQFKMGFPPAPAKLWLDTYYVPLDSIDSWHDKDIIQGQYISLMQHDNGLLNNYVIINFSRKPTQEEYQELIKRHGLTRSVWKKSFTVQYRKGYGHWFSAQLPSIRADVIAKITHDITQNPIVDWVENNVHTGEPVPVDQ